MAKIYLTTTRDCHIAKIAELVTKRDIEPIDLYTTPPEGLFTKIIRGRASPVILEITADEKGGPFEKAGFYELPGLSPADLDDISSSLPQDLYF